MSGWGKMILVATVALLPLLPCHCQSRSLGATFSFSNIGISYEHELNAPGTYIETALRAETAEMFAGRKKYPGVSASVVWNNTFKEWESSAGNTIKLYAGLGLAAGYAPDLQDVNGLFGGLKGKIGGECLFTRKTIISIALTPILGLHLVEYPDHYTMKFYNIGLIYSFAPEIGIKYRF
jgi:hypothetical protein